MGGGKSRRHTAKTGDKSLYNNRSSEQQLSSQIVERGTNKKRNNAVDDDDDLIYDPVDQFHNNDYLRLDHDMDNDDDSDDNDGIAVEEVMRLDDEEIEEEGDEDDEDEDEDDDQEDDDDDEEEEEERIISSDDDLEDDDDDNKNDGIRDWGAKKMAYYYGDTADLEIGQEVEEALLEEDAAKDVLNARHQDMTEDDFMMDGDIENDNENRDYLHRAAINDNAYTTNAATATTTTVNMTLARLLQLSTKEKRQLLKQQNHHELIPLLSYFTQTMMVPYTTTTRKATDAIFYSSHQDEIDERENTADVSSVLDIRLDCFVLLFLRINLVTTYPILHP